MATTRPMRLHLARFWRPAANGSSVALLALLVFAGCAPSAGTSTARAPSPMPTATLIPTATATPQPPVGVCETPVIQSASDRTILPGSPLPKFSDWRLAYIGTDQRLHAISLDGKADVAGPDMPLGTTAPGGIWTAGTSPDGMHLAYYCEGILTLLNVTTRAAIQVNPPTGDSEVLWSPDERYVALNDTGYVMLVNTQTGKTATSPPMPGGTLQPPFMVGGTCGWLDVSHIGVIDQQASSKTTLSFGSLNITTGQLRAIATFPADEETGTFAVEPGGQYTLFDNNQFQANPFTPRVDLIDNATGSVTPLPHLAHILPGGGFNIVLWRPGTPSQAVVTSFPENGDPRYYLIDVNQDTAVPLNLPDSPEAWTPDGSTLIVATTDQFGMDNEAGEGDVGSAGSGPYTLYAYTIGGQGQVGGHITLTTRAANIPLLGFIHTA